MSKGRVLYGVLANGGGYAILGGDKDGAVITKDYNAKLQKIHKVDVEALVYSNF